MANILITEDQLKLLVQKHGISEENHKEKDNKMLKQHLYTIATIAQKLYEVIGDDQEVEDWVHSKIAVADESMSAVAKNVMYGESEDIKGMDNLDMNDLIIGK